MARVLVTRPQPSADATARRLAALGHEATIFPLSELRPLSAAYPPEGSVDAIAATSANAFRMLASPLPKWLLARPCFAVGGRTADAAHSAGFGDVRMADADGISLAAMVSRELPAGSRLAYFCGRVRRPEFEAALASAEILCLPVETYDTVFPEPDIEMLSRRLGGLPPDFALVYSPQAAGRLARLVAEPTSAHLFEATVFFCISRAVAHQFDAIAGARVRWSDNPCEDSLLALLAAG